MSVPAYNPGALQSLPAIIPSTDALFVLASGTVRAAAVTTSFGKSPVIRSTYRFAELDGVGEQRFGLAAEPINWRIEAQVASGADRIAFEDKLRQHKRAGKRLILQHEWDNRDRTYVVLVDYEYLEILPTVGGGEFLVMTISFEDQQPYGGA